MKPRTPPAPTTPYNDLDLRQWKEYGDIWTDSHWLIPSRARGNGHALEYHGNFVPQIATQAIRRFTRPEDVVLDLFLGSGTTAVEAARLGRRCIGVELKPELVEHVAARMQAAASEVRLIAGDSAAATTAEAVRSALAEWDRSHADLLRRRSRMICMFDAFASWLFSRRSYSAMT